MIRRRYRTVLWVAGVCCALWGLWRCFVTVDETETVMVTQFGRYVATLREAGLHRKMPYQSVMRFDRRLQVYDPRPSEFLTSDPKNILLDVYVCWRISEPLAFLQRVTDRAGAEARLHDIVWAELAAAIGRCPLAALVSDQEGEMDAAKVMAGVRDRCRERVGQVPGREDGESFGIEIVDVRLKRVTLPEQNRQSVFDRMRAERDRIARQYRAEGEEEALKIRAEADWEKSRLLAEARRDAEKTRGEAAEEAIRIYAEAHGKDPEFYRFYRSLESYRKILGEKTTVMLGADSELMRYLVDPRAAVDHTPDAPRTLPAQEPKP
ncbi:MAG: protease modulator HflC [Lentisphaeria bacterium]|nr:protease modulator HflC [Lentisphaeria bacterium]